MQKFSLALVTGATSGIGEALAELLASKGIPLLITGRQIDKLQALQEKLSKLVPVEIQTASLEKLSERESLISLIHARKPNLVINNAGFGLYGAAVDLPTDQQRNLLEVNVVAVQDLTLESAKSMVNTNQRGIILNISSAASFQVFPWFAAYAASKAFVTAFSQALDYELKPRGVRVLVSCPGQVATHFSSHAGRKKQVRNQSGVMTVQFAAESIWKQIEQEKPLVIFDWKYNFLTRLSTFFPTSWIAPLLQKIMQKRKKEV